jgi:hypothetical protein
MTDEERKKIREARLILCPEDKKLRQANLESFKRMKKLFFPEYSVATIRQLESSSAYKPSSRLQKVIDRFLVRAAIKDGRL